MIVDNVNSFIFGSKNCPEWFQKANVEYIYDEEGKKLKGAIIKNPTGEILNVSVGDKIVWVQATYRGPIVLVIPKDSK